MTGEKNYYKYVTTDSKQAYHKVLQLTMLEYMQKTAGVFDEGGMLSKEQVNKMKDRVKSGAKNIWHGFISFNENYSHKIETPEDCIRLLKRTFGEFLKDINMPRENIDLMCALHLDKPKHFHIHFSFWEKEPKIKNQRAKGYLYRAKGRLPMQAIDRMVERLNAFAISRENMTTRDNVMEFMKDKETLKVLRDNEFIKFLVRDLVKEIPKDNKRSYGHYSMKEHRTSIDILVDAVIKTNPKLEQAHEKFCQDLEQKREELSSIMSSYYEERRVKEWRDSRTAIQDVADVPPQQIHTIERLEKDYRRRLGNIVLREVRYIQNQEYYYNKKKKHKVNDKKLKRSITISNRIISKSLDKFVNNVISMFEPQLQDYSNRLEEIEEEIKQEHEQSQQQNSRSKYDWGK